MKKILVLVAAALALTACPKKEKPKEPKATKAGANLEAKSGSSVSGNVQFEMTGDGRLKMTLLAQGLNPGDHGVHIHETGDCSAADASSAGGHFNPGEKEHGAPSSAMHHAGDLGNINANASGTGSMSIAVDGLTLQGKTGVIGKALIIHEKPDDMTTQPTGGAGGRVACAVIKAM